ncbi:MAG: CHC2 zinc finger domain-containing protein [Actinomycetota bacterium]|nr:CHC2 zinc finger domain-containing protein [Actinomycetota bacterium]MDP9485129.1 CHC2 zinc finger domain-containing protein [Actinomycetota bacterium]
MTTNTTAPTSSAAPPEGVYENPRPYGERRLSDAIKEAVPVETLASDLGAELRRTGKEKRGLCPVHGGRNRDAFAVYPDGGWWCFNCDEGGDVIALWMRAKNCLDFKTALIDLAGLYGVEAPPRSEGWRRWSVEKGRRHDALREIRTRLYQRRFMRLYADDLARIEDPAEREEEARAIYADLYNLARTCAEWRAGR